MRHPRRLIKIPIGVYLLLTLLVYNVYQFFHPERPACYDAIVDVDEIQKNSVFTAIRQVDFHATHYKMFRRQFRHLHDEKNAANRTYDEIFLDMNGYEERSISFEQGFGDTIFTDNPAETFLQELGK